MNNNRKESLVLVCKGFAMGIADIVPGVSGGTIALITGVYEKLIQALSSINKNLVKDLFNLNFKSIFEKINFSFLFPLGLGILTAIITMSKVVHYFMDDFPIYTWSLFFGLICSSIIFISKKIENLKKFKNISFILLGTLIGYAVVSLVPLDTPDTALYVFGSGAIAICAMILPGISGSFLLLILGKYLYVTSAIKAPLATGSIETMVFFGLGCIVGLLSFSKLLNYLLSKFHGPTLSLLVGFMLGSIKKIWPWREVLESKIIRGKTYVLSEQNILPHSFDVEVILAIITMITGFSLVFILEKFGTDK